VNAGQMDRVDFERPAIIELLVVFDRQLFHKGLVHSGKKTRVVGLRGDVEKSVHLVLVKRVNNVREQSVFLHYVANI